MSEYVSVLNQALDRHASEFPLKQVLELLERYDQDGKRVGVAVYSSDPDSPHDYFTLRLNAGRRVELSARGKDSPDLEWKVSRAYLEKVADDKSEYIDNPSRLDWDWIKSRLGS